MQMLGQPNAKASQPWEAGIACLALGPHEYSPPEFQAVIDYALANGGQEITAEEYQALQPLPETEPCPKHPTPTN